MSSEVFTGVYLVSLYMAHVQKNKARNIVKDNWQLLFPFQRVFITKRHTYTFLKTKDYGDIVMLVALLCTLFAQHSIVFDERTKFVFKYVHTNISFNIWKFTAFLLFALIYKTIVEFISIFSYFIHSYVVKLLI